MSAAITAVIVNYNAGETLGAVVGSLTAEREVARVIVVDNASSDGSLERLAGAASAHVELIRNTSNLGFAAGCNRGAAVADTPYLLFINPDCRVETGALPRLLTVLQSRNDAAMAGPLILGSDGREQRGCRRYLPDPRRGLMRVLGLGGPGANGWVGGFDLTGTPLPEAPAAVEAISGACMLVKRDAYVQVGGWDEGYFLHCEDLDLCMRFGLQGLRVLFVPDAIVHHTQGVSSRGRSVFVSWHKHRGMWRYFTKFQRRTSPIWLAALVWLGIWSRFLLLLPRAWSASLGGSGQPGSHAA